MLHRTGVRERSALEFAVVHERGAERISLPARNPRQRVLCPYVRACMVFLETTLLTRAAISDFLDTLDDGSFFTSPQTVTPSLMSAPTFPDPAAADNIASTYITQPTSATEPSRGATAEPHAAPEEPAPPLLPSATKTEKFLLTAADQESGSRDERLNRVIRSKYEAGLLKPYDYVKGYARLSRWMDRK